MTAGHLRAGQQAETTARRWLQRKGLKHLYSNFRCRFGELDLIMLDADCLVIVEVRLRKSAGFGGAIGSISRAKQLRIARATQLFLRQHKDLLHTGLRFDVIALTGAAANPAIDWRRQAFTFDASQEFYS